MHINQIRDRIRSGFKLFCALLGITQLFAADAPKGAGGKLNGTWLPQSGELGGKPFPVEVLKAITLTIENGNYDVVVIEPQGPKHDSGTVKYLNNLAPKGMDVTGTNGPNVGKTFPSIYQVDADTLKICYDLAGMKRPEEFKSAPGTKQFFVTYQRKKD